MGETTVYVREKSKDKIRCHSWTNPKVSVKVQFDNLNIFSRASSTLHKVFREFYRHFKFLQPLEFDFGEKLANRPVINIFFSTQRFLAKNLKSTKAEKVLNR